MNTRAILIGGIAASLVIAMWEMVVEAVLPDGAGFFVRRSRSVRRSSVVSRALRTRSRSTPPRS
jgi:hypothetical protein